MKFDYTTTAELYLPKSTGGSIRRSMGYRRFDTAAGAIRFAIEDFPAVLASGVWMLVGDERFNIAGIRQLYESQDYPRRARKRGTRKAA
jgi:hypothetical protein